MDCQGAEPTSTREFMRRWNERAERNRVPLSGTIELTRRCNLECVHCYIGSQDAQRSRRERELTATEWCSVLDQAAAEGCLQLLITGGDPLLRPDFPVVYRHAKQLGLLVTVFTNGTLVTDRIVELFAELPPLQVEITLYGATAVTYEGITRVRGSFRRCIEGIELLRRGGTRVGLKTILMTANCHEFEAIQETARSYGANFRFDPAIMPRMNGDTGPLELRVSPAEAVERDFADPKRAERWVDFFSRREAPPVQALTYGCGAGITLFNVDPFGTLQMCMMAPEPRFDLRTGSFQKGWREAIPPVRFKKAPADNACLECELLELCGRCPGFFELETGSASHPSKYVCELGRLRREKIRHLVETA